MTVLSILASIFGVINGLANVPQIIKIFKTKSAKDISILTYSILAVGSFVWILYGIEISNAPILIMNGLGLTAILIVLFGCWKYG